MGHAELDRGPFDEWKEQLEVDEIDFIPDPMILRSAELFLLGKSGAGEAGIGGDGLRRAVRSRRAEHRGALQGRSRG